MVPENFQKLFLKLQGEQIVRVWYRNVFFRIQRPYVNRIEEDFITIKATVIFNNKKFNLLKQEPVLGFGPHALEYTLNNMVHQIFEEMYEKSRTDYFMKIV